MCSSPDVFETHDSLSCGAVNESDCLGNEAALKFWYNFFMRTLLDWFNYRGRRKPELRRAWESADEWIFHPDPEDAAHLTSFDDTCAILNRDPTVVRRDLREMTVDEFHRRYRGAGKQ